MSYVEMRNEKIVYQNLDEINKKDPFVDRQQKRDLFNSSEYRIKTLYNAIGYCDLGYCNTFEIIENRIKTRLLSKQYYLIRIPSLLQRSLELAILKENLILRHIIQYEGVAKAILYVYLENIN